MASAQTTILLIFEYPTMNGGEHSMLSCLRVLMEDRANALQFIAACPDTGPLAKSLKRINIPIVDFRIHDPDGRKRSTDELQQQIGAIVNRIRPSLVHSNSLAMSRHIGRMPGEIFRGVIRCGHLRDIIKLSRAAINDLNRNDGLVAVSQATLDFHVGQGLDVDFCQAIHNGVDTSQFAVSNKQRERERWFPELPADAVLLLNVGQICLRKGQAQSAQAVSRLIKDFPSLHLVLAGQRHSTKAESIRFEQSIENVFRETQSRDHLHLLGHQQDIPSLMNAADLLVHSARQEPLGRVLLEAASCRLPVIATAVGGTTEIFPDESFAALCQPDVDSLAEQIRQFLIAPNRAHARAEKAQKRIEDKFNLGSAAQSLLRFWIAHLAAGPRKTPESGS